LSPSLTHSSQLSHLSDSLNKIIRIDPFSLLPREVSLRILGYLDAISLGRAAQVSRSWKALADDDLLWRRMCGQHIDRKCEKCGWGLPLLERKRLKVELKDRSPAAAMGIAGHSSHGHDGIQQLMTRSEALGVDHIHTHEHVDPRSVVCESSLGSTSSLKRPAESISAPAHREKRARIEGDGSDSENEIAPTAGMLTREVRLTRPWKSVYCERLVVERNWRKGRCQLKTLKGHTDGVMCLQYHTTLTNPHYPVLITGSYDRTVRIWNLDTGEVVRVLRGHTRAVRALQFDQMVLFTGSADGTVRMWNWRKGECMRVFEGHSDGVLALNYNGYLLASGSNDNTIIVRNFRSSTQFTLRGHEDCVSSVLIWDGKTSPGDLDPTMTTTTFTQALKPRTRASPDPQPDLDVGTMLFSASDDCTIKLWDLATHECIRTFSGHRGQVQSLRVLMIDQPKEDDEERDREVTPPASGWAPASLSPPPALSAVDNAPADFDAAAHARAREEIVPRVYVHEEDHDRKRRERTSEREERRPVLASGSLDGTIKMWDVETGRERNTLFGHIEGVWAIDMDALRLASASHDRTVKVWDHQSGHCVQTLTGHRGAVTSLQLSDDMIVSGSEDGEVMVWNFGPQQSPSASAIALNGTPTL
jgi:F-box/WD-40 domain protein MET30